MCCVVAAIIRHLEAVRTELLERLTRLNRMELYQSEMKRLSDPALYKPRDPMNAWTLIRRGSSKIVRSYPHLSCILC